MNRKEIIGNKILVLLLFLSYLRGRYQMIQKKVFLFSSRFNIKEIQYQKWSHFLLFERQINFEEREREKEKIECNIFYRIFRSFYLNREEKTVQSINRIYNK
jgi:hypothetical protein